MKPCDECGEVRPNCYCHEQRIPILVPLILCTAFWTGVLLTAWTLYSFR